MQTGIKHLIAAVSIVAVLASVLPAQSEPVDKDSIRLEDVMKKEVFKKKPVIKTPEPAAAPAAETTAESNTLESLMPPIKTDLPGEAADKSEFDAKPAEGAPTIPALPEIPEIPAERNDAKATPNNQNFAMQRDEFKKIVPLTMSRSERIQKRNRPLNMLPENASVTGKVGKIRKTDDGWYVVEYETTSDQAPFASQRLLPCRVLESAIELTEKNPDTRFAIYGQATVFRDTPYLLLRRITLPDDKDAVREEFDLGGKKPQEEDSGDAAKTPTPLNESTSEADETSDIISALLSHQEGEAVRTDFAPKHSAAENVKSVAPAGGTPFHRGRENLVIDRLARIIKPAADATWYEIRFESDNTLREPPYMVLPNAKLEEAIELSDKLGRSENKFRISGEVTYFQGKRYLLITKVFTERDMRQF